jgi:3-oxoacyl-[acyl-carrier-protein] synthase-3
VRVGLNYARIIAAASAVPDRIVTNDDLAGLMETSDEWISTRTGIKRRHISTGETTSFLASQVAGKLLDQTQISPEDIELIIVATMSPDAYTPSVAARVQASIGARNAACFDLSAACSGFVYALEAGEKLLTRDGACALVIGAEVLSKLLDWSERSTAVLFGDGAGGVLIKRDAPERRFLASSLKTYGEMADSIKAGETQAGCFPKTCLTYRPFQMDGRAVYKFATHEVPETIQAVCQKAGVKLAQVDRFLLHQANYRIIKQVARRLELPLAKFPVNIADYGNTSAASEAILLSECWQKQEVQKGDLILLAGFGGGLTTAGMLVRL